MRKHLWSLLWLCLAVSLTYAQQKGSPTATTPVSGTVTDEKGLPLAAVTITALTADRRVTTTAVTDINGVFKLNMSGRVRTLQFSYIGLEEQFVPIEGRTNF